MRRRIRKVDFSVALPLEIIELLFDKLGIPRLWRLRQVSRRLQWLVREYLTSCKRLDWYNEGDHAWFFYQIRYCCMATRRLPGIRFWVTYGACIHHNHLLQMVSVYDDIKAVRALLESGGSEKPDVNAVMPHVKSLAVVRALLEHGGNPNCPRLIRQAVRDNRLDVVRLLLKHNADVRFSGDWPLRQAVECNHTAMAELLLTHGDADAQTNDNSCLVQAVLAGNIKLVRILLKHGADLHAQNNEAFRMACERRRYHIMRLLVDRGTPVDVDGLRCALGDLKTFKCLLAHMGNPNEHYKFLLQTAIDNGCDDTIHFLLTVS